MLLVLITLTLITIGVISFCVGAWLISRYAFRISSGTGVGVLLFPPYTFWFAFFQLEQDGKEIPIATWLFGLVSTILLIFVFWTPLNSMMTKGIAATAEQYSGVGEAAVDAYGTKEGTSTEETAEEPEEEPAEEPAPATTANNGTTANAGTTGTTGGATTNNGTTPSAGTTGAAAPAAAQ